ncbi:MAG TPA: sugar-binding transcriptional regulator [Caldilineae bacterium]|nr:sugar-binding transcriptional regulator [Caldilineae bacterium]
MPRRGQRQRRDVRLLSKVSKLYYEQFLTQQQIADKLHLSRPKVSRLLKQARDEGIVQITVRSPSGIYPDLEYQLEQKFGLREVVITETPDPTSQEITTREVGIAAAEYLQRMLRDGDVIGVTWGTTLHSMVAALQPLALRDVHVVQLLGGLGPPESEVHATELCRRLARLLGAGLTLLPAPGIVDSLQAKEAILSDSHVQRAFEMIDRVNVAFVGIGSPTPTSVVMRDGSILTQEELQELRRRGAVGDIALRFINAEGEPIRSDLDNRVIGITLDQLKRIKCVVGVAGGPEKEAVIRGALLGGYLKVLVTDHITAMRLLGLVEPVASDGMVTEPINHGR